MRTTPTLLLLLPFTASAQCPFDPTIEPANPILCPNASIDLVTQPYDAYQWYKDGSPINGATGQSLGVAYSTDAGSEFHVEATLNGCTELSPTVLVDGWVFLLPFVIHGGDEPLGVGGNGEALYCEGDVMTLTLGTGYTENITWYRNGQVIDGENDVTLVVTTSGSYTCSAAPGTCPDAIMQLGVDVVVLFQTSAQPTIVTDPNGDLCATPEGNSYQWYLNGIEFGDTPCITAEFEGAYTVFVDYGEDCQIASEPVIITTIADGRANTLRLAPNPVTDAVRITWPEHSAPQGGWTITDRAGRAVLSGSFAQGAALRIDLGPLAKGIYTLVPADRTHRPLRFVKQ